VTFLDVVTSSGMSHGAVLAGRAMVIDGYDGVIGRHAFG
jgi:hypothetical protein